MYQEKCEYFDIFDREMDILIKMYIELHKYLNMCVCVCEI